MFSDQLTKLRKINQLTQKDLANVLQCSTSRIGMFEQGRRSPDLDTLNALADYFQVTTDFLLDRQLHSDQIKEAPAPYDYRKTKHPLVEYIEERLIEANLLTPAKSAAIDDLMLFVLYGETAALEILKERQKK